MQPFEQIKHLLDGSDIEYELVEHAPATTSQEAQAITGWPMESGAKSILFKASDNFILTIVRGSNRVDFKKLRNHLKIRKLRLAKPEEVLDVMGVEIGACYPFGEIAGVDMLVDHTLSEHDKISFSPGTHTHHIRMRWQDYRSLTQPELIDLHVEESKF